MLTKKYIQKRIADLTLPEKWDEDDETKRKVRKLNKLLEKYSITLPKNKDIHKRAKLVGIFEDDKLVGYGAAQEVADCLGISATRVRKYVQDKTIDDYGHRFSYITKNEVGEG